MNLLVCMITRLYILAYPVPEHASLLHLVYRLSLDARSLFFLAMFLTPASKVRRLFTKIFIQRKVKLHYYGNLVIDASSHRH